MRCVNDPREGIRIYQDYNVLQVVVAVVLIVVLGAVVVVVIVGVDGYCGCRCRCRCFVGGGGVVKNMLEPDHSLLKSDVAMKSMSFLVFKCIIN